MSTKSIDDAHHEGRRACVAGVRYQDNPYSHALDYERFHAWQVGHIAVAENPTAEPGWVHRKGCVCGRCDRKGGYTNPDGPIPEPEPHRSILDSGMLPMPPFKRPAS